LEVLVAEGEAVRVVGEGAMAVDVRAVAARGEAARVAAALEVAMAGAA
jgi:hypothetical protein